MTTHGLGLIRSKVDALVDLSPVEEATKCRDLESDGSQRPSVSCYASVLDPWPGYDSGPRRWPMMQVAGVL